MDGNFVVSGRWYEVLASGSMVQGATKGACSKCGEPVAVAPTSRRHLASNPDIQLLCLQCALPLIRADVAPEIGLVPGAMKELEQHRQIPEKN